MPGEVLHGVLQERGYFFDDGAFWHGILALGFGIEREPRQLVGRR